MSKNIKMSLYDPKKTKLFKFLNQFKVSSTDKKTHASMGKPFGKWMIPPENLEEFHDLYHRHIFKQNFDCCMVELPQQISPIKVDIDLRWENEELSRIYTMEHIEEILKPEDELPTMQSTCLIKDKYKIFPK